MGNYTTNKLVNYRHFYSNPFYEELIYQAKKNSFNPENTVVFLLYLEKLVWYLWTINRSDIEARKYFILNATIRNNNSNVYSMNIIRSLLPPKYYVITNKYMYTPKEDSKLFSQIYQNCQTIYWNPSGSLMTCDNY